MYGHMNVNEILAIVLAAVENLWGEEESGVKETVKSRDWFASLTSLCPAEHKSLSDCPIFIPVIIPL